jgi:hypothetical protein
MMWLYGAAHHHQRRRTVQLSLNQALMSLIGLCGLMLPGILKQLNSAEWLKGIIAGVVVAAASAGEVLLGGKITGNTSADFALFAAAFSALLAGPLKPLDSYLTESWFNVVKPKAAAQATPVLTPRASATASQATAPDLRRVPQGWPPQGDTQGSSNSGG